MDTKRILFWLFWGAWGLMLSIGTGAAMQGPTPFVTLLHNVGLFMGATSTLLLIYRLTR